ncbi:DUF2567 domain-containing protein [Smaragdicoccus niigatensis]|uniref:DUF2567 domain-containing protein n=1 Tax=Smaragdicoccus niigatensis TaxID=359359 RepID=UPI00035D239B|nr:DUF2567 domain-containing protein [Smaragdicoccus niigatensis]
MRRAVSRILAGVLIVNMLAGVAWAFIARPVRFVIVDNGLGQSLDGESANEFGAIGWFALISAVLGLVLAVAAWSYRGQRGIPLLYVIIATCALGSLSMAAIGELIVRLRYPIVDDPKIGAVVSIAPKIFDGTIPVVLALEPLIAAVVIFVMAALSPFDDLGSGRHASTAESAVPTGSTSG